MSDLPIRSEIIETGNPKIKSARIVISAPASQIFAIIADPKRHQEIDGSSTITSNIGFQWCNLTSGTISGALGTALGTGKQNTTDMVAACSSGAANAARGYTANGYSDWFLPSYTELATFRSTLTPIMTAKGWGGTERIWTSSQGGTGNANAWFIGLDGYNNAADGKQQSYPVFPIRSWAN